MLKPTSYLEAAKALKAGRAVLDEQEREWTNAEEYLHSGVLGFCGCGAPDLVLKLIRDGLRHIEQRHTVHRQAEEEALFGGAAGLYFFWYWADKEGFTEHGSSVPGWLTEKGEDLLVALDEYLLDKA